MVHFIMGMYLTIPLYVIYCHPHLIFNKDMPIFSVSKTFFMF